MTADRIPPLAQKPDNGSLIPVTVVDAVAAALATVLVLFHGTAAAADMITLATKVICMAGCAEGLVL